MYWERIYNLYYIIGQKTQLCSILIDFIWGCFLRKNGTEHFLRFQYFAHSLFYFSLVFCHSRLQNPKFFTITFYDQRRTGPVVHRTGSVRRHWISKIAPSFLLIPPKLSRPIINRPLTISTPVRLCLRRQ